MTAKLRTWISRLAGFFRKARLDADFDRELEAHLQLAVDDFTARGMSPGEAYRRARIELGSLEGTKEAHRELRGLPLLDGLLRDLRFACRTLGRDRGIAAVSILVLGLGIGATTTVFSVVNAVLLKPLPFHQPERLTWIAYRAEEAETAGLSAVSPRVDVFEGWRDRSRSFEAMSSYNAFFAFGSHRLSGGPEPARLVGVRVARDLFDVLGVAPRLGRTFDPHEVLVGGPPAVLLSHHLWKLRFGADPAVVGGSVLLDDQAVTVVGVMPEELDFGAVFAPGVRVDLFTPLRYEEVRTWGNTLGVVGRLRPGVSQRAAQAELEGITTLLKEENPGLGNYIEPRVEYLEAEVRGSTRRSLVILLICVGAVLTITCANISNLQLARSISRRKEFAIRTALGAGQPHVLRQLLTEGLLLSGLGGLLGLGVAHWATGAITGLQAVALPLLYRVEVDGAALLVSSAVVLVTGLAFGLAPAWQMTPQRLHDSLKDSARGSTGGAWQQRARSSLVVAEMALACMLLVGAGLLARSFLQVLEVDLGFQADQALTLNIDTGAGDLPLEQRLARVDGLLDAVAAVPGVRGAAVTDALPLDRNRTWGISVRGQDDELGEPYGTFVIRVGADYFRTLGVPLLAGRDFGRFETADRQPVVVINRPLALRLFPAGDPLGRLVRIGGEDRTVVGVVAAVRHGGVEGPSGFEAYLPMRQAGASAIELVVRTQGPPAAVQAEVRRALASADRNLPLADLRPLSWLVERAVSPRRFFLSLLSAFAVFALLLASLGIYGVVSSSVGQRAGEIGIRLALGASAAQVRRQVLRETLSLAGLGILAGTCGALLLARAMSSLLFGVDATDPATFGSMLALAVLIALVAGLAPAIRAGRVDPLEALRQS